MQDLITSFVMNSWGGGCDLWVHKAHMAWQGFDVWHCQHDKSNVLTPHGKPNTLWNYQGQTNWWTYGSERRVGSWLRHGREWTYCQVEVEQVEQTYCAMEEVEQPLRSGADLSATIAEATPKKAARGLWNAKEKAVARLFFHGIV